MNLSRQQHREENLAMIRETRSALAAAGKHPQNGIRIELERLLPLVKAHRDAGDSPFLQELEKRLRETVDMF